jgi:SAM-dependent methyltransferase
MTDFDVNQYWLQRGRTYIGEERLDAPYYRLQEQFLIGVLASSGMPLGRIVEIGCGYGRITKLLAENFPQARIFALDLSPNQLENARRYCAGLPNITFGQYDIYSSEPLPEAPYDAAVAIEVLLHHPPEAVRNVSERLSAAATHVVNLDWSEDWPGDRPEHVWIHDYQALFRSLGLESIELTLPRRIDGMQQRLFISGRELRLDVSAAQERASIITALDREGEVQRDARAAIEWTEQRRLVTQDLAHFVPLGEVILVDDAQLGISNIEDRRVLPFLEGGGDYWGPPADDATAIRELERMRQEGAAAIAFAATSFWWLDYFAGFARHLRTRYATPLENERLVVFDLRSGA